MKYLQRSLSSLFLLLCTCSHLDGSSKSEDWNQHMRELAAAFSTLLPHLTSEKTLDDALRSGKLDEAIKTLRSAAAQIKTVDERPSLDPSLSITAAQFDHEIRRGTNALNSKDIVTAFKSLNQVSRYCISCHTILETDIEPYLSELDPEFEKLSYLQRGDFYLSTRRYSDAVYEYERGLMDPSWAQLNKKEWNDHMQRLLSVTVRVKNSPPFALEMINRFFDSSSYPNEARPAAMIWRRHIKEWRQDLRKNSPFSKLKPREQAKALLDQADKEAKSYGKISVRVLALRASRIIHDELATNRKSANDAQWLYLAGQSSLYLSDMEIGAVPEVFFDRCIGRRPHSPLAAKCFARLEELLKTPRLKESLSPFVQSRIEYLATLASPKEN